VTKSGTFNVTVTTPNGANTGYNLTPADITFSNTCPTMINYHAEANRIVPDLVTRIIAGLCMHDLLLHHLQVEPVKSIDYV